MEIKNLLLFMVSLLLSYYLGYSQDLDVSDQEVTPAYLQDVSQGPASSSTPDMIDSSTIQEQGDIQRIQRDRDIPFQGSRSYKAVMPANYTTGFNEASFIDMLDGEDCFQINSITVNSIDPNVQLGTFTNGIAGSGLEIDEGILLTTGSVDEAFTDNSSNGSSEGTSNATAINDADLDALALNGLSTHREAIITVDFDVVQAVNAFRIPFQFASEEYNEYVCGAYNDVFSVFIAGPGINGFQTISLIPGTSNPVAINYVNNGSCGASGSGEDSDLTQSALFIDNTVDPHPIYSEFDGFTTMLYAEQPGLMVGTYQIKLAIANVGDAAFDSGVFFGPMQAVSGGVVLDCDCLNDPLADLNGDCDGDGVLNGDETDATAALNPCDPNPMAVPTGDCDGDGVLNQDETDIASALDPCTPDPLGVSIGDCDGDGVTNQLETDAAAALNSCDPDPLGAPLGDCDGDGILNGVDVCPEIAGDAPTGCPDNDGDSVLDDDDLDDDNDGILDVDEMNCSSTLDLADFNFSGIAVVSLSSDEIRTRNRRYRSSYSDEVLVAPIHLEFNMSTAAEGMFGLLPEGGTEVQGGWNDDAYKWYNYQNYLYGRFNDSWDPYGVVFSDSDVIEIDVDANGVLTASINGVVQVTRNTGETRFYLAVTSGSPVQTFSNIVLEASNYQSCLEVDSDGDTIPDHFDLDSDGDYCYDAIEVGANTGDLLPDGSFSGGVDSNGVPLLASGGLSVTPELLDPSAQSDNCCDVSDGTIDCDLDGFTNAEELAGVCGYVGNPNDYNSPFKHQETTGSGTTDDMIYQLELVNVIGYLEEGKDVHLTIKSGHSLVLNSDISVRNLTVETGASLDLNGYRLLISGDLRLDGDFTHSMGHLYMSDDCEARHIYGSGTKQLHELTIENQHGVTLHTGLEVSGPIHPESGVFDLNSQDVVLTSYPIDGTVRTGSISEIKTGADVIGNITIQRYVESLEDGYRFLGPPIKNLQVSDISDDFVTTGFPGSDYPNHYFTNLKFYDEDDRPTNALESGYKDVTSTTDALAEYQGYWAYFPPSTSVNVLDATGEFYKGDVVYDLSYTFTDSPHCDGWHCIINPYPSAIDLTSSCIEFTNVSGAIYILDHEMGGTWQGEYVVYNNGISVNGGTGVVASFQAFMVQATGPNASITFRECAKTDEQGVFYRSSEEEKSFIRLALDKNDEAYETVIAFDESATTSYDPEFDGRRWKAEMYSLATVMEEDTLSINTLPEIGEDLSVPILVTAPDSGVYQLKISEVSNLDPLYCMFIEDTQTGELMPVVSGGELEFEVTEEAYYEERFILHAHRIVDMETNPPYCSDENSGSAEVSLSGGGDGFFKWYDFTDALILEEEGSSSELSGVPSGTYYVQVSGSNMLCGTSWVEVEIGVGEGEIVEINSTPDYCSGGFANLKVKVLGAESWTVHLYKDYEEITSGSSSDLVEFTDLEGAIYDVVVETACSRNEYVLDLSDPDAVKADFEAPGELLIENIGVELEVEALSENADRHQWFLDEYFQGDDDIISLTFDEVGSYTLKLNSSNEYCSDAYQQEIMVSAASVIQENLEKDFLTINREAQFEIVRLNDLTGKIQVKLYDAKGSTIYEQMDTGKTKITIDKSNLSPGVYILEIKTEAGRVLSKKYSK